MLGTCHPWLVSAFLCGHLCPDCPLSEGTCSPMRDSHLLRALLQVAFRQEAGRTPPGSSSSNALQIIPQC